MSNQDELLSQVLAVAGHQLAALVGFNLARDAANIGQFKQQAGPLVYNPPFTDAYLGAFRLALRTVLTAYLEAGRGAGLSTEQAILVDSVTDNWDPDLTSELRETVEREAPLWLPGTEAHRDMSLVASLVTTYVRTEPGLLQAVVQAVRLAREARIELGSAANLSGPLLKPVPLEGDVLARELSGPARAFGIRLLSGFLGPSDVPGYRRLYRNLEFNEYLDIPDSAIIKTLDLRTMANPVGGSLVWVAVGIKLIHGSVGYTRPELEGRFLAGDGGGGGWDVRGEWTGPRGEWTGPRGEWTGPRGEWTGPRGEWTGPRG